LRALVEKQGNGKSVSDSFLDFRKMENRSNSAHFRVWARSYSIHMILTLMDLEKQGIQIFCEV